MGQIYNLCKGLKKSYPEETIKWSKALIDPGKGEIPVKVAELTADEVERLLLKLDQLTLSRQNEAIAVMVAEEMESIINLVRAVKEETKSPFEGILGVGASLDIAWLRPKDVGVTALLNKDATASCGLNAGTSGAVYTWLSTLTANTSVNIIPEQTMSQYAGLIHLGAIDTVEVPKINGITFTLSGVACPRQSVAMNLRRSFGNQDLPLVRWEKPVMLTPQKKQLVTVKPYISGDSKFELLSLLVARAQDLTL